jgi:hypothetical protein
MSDGKEGNESGGDFPYPWARVEREVEDEVACFVRAEPNRSTGEELRDIGCLRVNRPGRTAEHHEGHESPSRRGTQVAAFTIEAQQLL